MIGRDIWDAPSVAESSTQLQRPHSMHACKDSSHNCREIPAFDTHDAIRNSHCKLHSTWTTTESQIPTLKNCEPSICWATRSFSSQKLWIRGVARSRKESCTEHTLQHSSHSPLLHAAWLYLMKRPMSSRRTACNRTACNKTAQVQSGTSLARQVSRSACL